VWCCQRSAEVENVSESVDVVVVALGELVVGTVDVGEGCAEEGIDVGTFRPCRILECDTLRERPGGKLEVEVVEQQC